MTRFINPMQPASPRFDWQHSAVNSINRRNKQAD